MKSLATSRRATTKVKVGIVTIGGNSPIVIQSMATSATTNIKDCTEDALSIAQAGGEIVRYTAASVAEAKALKEIKDSLRKLGCNIPIVADVHFNPQAAFEAAKIVEKVRINPGNFIDARAKFELTEYTNAEYNAEIKRLETEFRKLLSLCREHQTALRIGVNHGSLSDRIMSRYGDTVNGMCESAMEFLRVCKNDGFDDVVVSMKSSNVAVMVEAYREIVKRMTSEGMSYPLHLGVTEAGEGEDGRVKSAIGIGTLLSEGIGDTIRVSLTEPPSEEIKVANAIVDHISKLKICTTNSLSKTRTTIAQVIYNTNQQLGMMPDSSSITGNSISLKCHELEKSASNLLSNPQTAIVFETDGIDFCYECREFFKKLTELKLQNRVVLKREYNETSLDQLTVKASIDFGWALLSGFGDAIMITNQNDAISANQIVSLSYSLLQSSRSRITRTEYISCPGCGRTQFSLQECVRKVKERCGEFKGVKIAIMGCNVNGPGEMADADFGYVGAGKGKVNLYRKQEIVEKGVDAEVAIDKLVELIRKG